MDEEWRAFQLSVPGPLLALGKTFSPVAELLAWSADGRNQPGSGFLVHPRVVVTAAHVVAFEGDHGPRLAKWVAINVGDARYWARSVTIRRGFFGDARSAFDLAMLLLDTPACDERQTCALADAVDTTVALAGQVCGFIGGIFQEVQIAAQQTAGQFLEYVTQNLPGCSGGPVIIGQRDGRPLVVGVHRYHDHAQNLGRALSLVVADLAAPLTALGILPPEHP